MVRAAYVFSRQDGMLISAQAIAANPTSESRTITRADTPATNRTASRMPIMASPAINTEASREPFSFQWARANPEPGQLGERGIEPRRARTRKADSFTTAGSPLCGRWLTTTLFSWEMGLQSTKRTTLSST
jgi:hypothetical protein